MVVIEVEAGEIDVNVRLFGLGFWILIMLMGLLYVAEAIVVELVAVGDVGVEVVRLRM